MKNGDFPVCYVSLPEGMTYSGWLRNPQYGSYGLEEPPIDPSIFRCGVTDASSVWVNGMVKYGTCGPLARSFSHAL